jgi:hypothetical protein
MGLGPKSYALLRNILGFRPSQENERIGTSTQMSSAGTRGVDEHTSQASPTRPETVHHPMTWTGQGDMASENAAAWEWVQESHQRRQQAPEMRANRIPTSTGQARHDGDAPAASGTADNSNPTQATAADSGRFSERALQIRERQHARPDPGGQTPEMAKAGPVKSREFSERALQINERQQAQEQAGQEADLNHDRPRGRGR